MLKWLILPLLLCCLQSLPLDSRADGLEEFRPKRQEVFEFVKPPQLTKEGEFYSISFTSKGYCDVTVTVEDQEGRILRHLASGVLGKNAPAPFSANSLAQRIEWDGKDDQGRYLTDTQNVVVRVSLGLKPEFEKNLLWLPKKRISENVPIIQATPEGVYVCESKGVDHLRLFTHQGEYVRTIYPFPADKIKDVKGLAWTDFPQGERLPTKQSLYQQTLLTSGNNASDRDRAGMGGRAATAMAIQGDKIALLYHRLNRLATDGTSGGRMLTGPEVTFTSTAHGMNADNSKQKVGPTSAAFSPDGKTLYLAGYAWRYTWSWDILHGVAKISYDSDGKPELFAGSFKQDDSGNKENQFNGPTSVACDKQGRVYVSDYINDRIQVFSPEGKLLKTIAVSRPAQIELHPKTQEIYVFSWTIHTRGLALSKQKLEPKLTHLGAYDNPRKLAVYSLPLNKYSGVHHPWYIRDPLVHTGEIDFYADQPTVWLATASEGNRQSPALWQQSNISMYHLAEGKLQPVRNFGDDVFQAEGRKKFPIWNVQHQRLYVNPKTGKLYLGEPDSGVANKAFVQLLEIDPVTGKSTPVDMPFNAEDIAFDTNGLIYLRTTDVIARYDPATWREVPWDYGEELPQVNSGSGGRSASLKGGLTLPSQSPVCFHQGGMYVAANGNLVVSCANRKSVVSRIVGKKVEMPAGYGKAYAPQVYPGRLRWGEVHLWDKHGEILYEDAVPGVGQLDGIAIDSKNAIYMMATPTRMLNGKKYLNEMSETLIKVLPGKNKFVSSSSKIAVPASQDSKSQRKPDLTNGPAGKIWVEGAQWFYGGVGFAGFNTSKAGGGCACWHARFALDYLGRSFAPEVDRYRVAVLDSAGNLILRIGRYGNVDSAGAESLVPLGSDEVGLMHAAFLATHSDRRLFIMDLGNARIVSVKLNYHASQQVSLTDATQDSAASKNE